MTSRILYKPGETSSPATDTDIEQRHMRGKSENEYWTFQQQLVARIEQEREMRRELSEALKQFQDPCDHGTLVTLEMSAMWCRFCMASVAIARAAKMEADNAR